MGNFNFGPNICHKRKREGGVGSRAEEGKGQTTVATAIKRTIAVAAGKTTINSIIIGVTFEEIVLSDLEASIEILSILAILNRVG